MASISPICKKCKNFISVLKSPTYIDFMIKKSLKSKTSKSHTWVPKSEILISWILKIHDSWKKTWSWKSPVRLPFEVIGIHNALPCSALPEAYGQKQKKSFWKSNKKVTFLVHSEKLVCITIKVKKYTGYLYLYAKNVKF